MSGFEELAQAPLGDNILAQIAATAREILAAQAEVAEREEDLRGAKGRLRVLQEQTLIELMNDAGQEQLVTADGLKVSIKEITRGQPTQENQAEAFAWLTDRGHGSIIKSEVKADLGKADAEQVQAAVNALSAVNVQPQVKKGVAWQTLGALVRELLANGEEVPLDILGVHIHKQADVKPVKK